MNNNFLPEVPYITFVWAEDEKQLIGNKGDLPWNLPSEMQYFKKITIDGVTIMGRKTYESIPNPPLENRINIILTRNKSYKAKGALVFHNKEEILNYLKQENIKKPIHVIGGPAIFNLFMDEVSILYRTIVEGDFDGDVFMPSIDYTKFEKIKCDEGIVDEKNIHPHKYCVYKRKDKINLY